jgi:hypothetical protein
VAGRRGGGVVARAHGDSIPGDVILPRAYQP